MRQHMFAPAAVACLMDDRLPYPDEVDEMAAKIWRESYRRLWVIEWSEVEPGSKLHASINAGAMAALGVIASLSPAVLDRAF